jgi:hypothetical protein
LPRWLQKSSQELDEIEFTQLKSRWAAEPQPQATKKPRIDANEREFRWIAEWKAALALTLKLAQDRDPADKGDGVARWRRMGEWDVCPFSAQCIPRWSEKSLKLWNWESFVSIKAAYPGRRRTAKTQTRGKNHVHRHQIRSASWTVLPANREEETSSQNSTPQYL